MRNLTSHKVNGLNEMLSILVMDEPGCGGASHVYDVIPTVGNAKGLRIEFQKGPLSETGGCPNGLSIESLLAICEDRLYGFQSGDFATRENAIALTKIQEAMMWLHRRTLDRVRRGVEGAMKK